MRSASPSLGIVALLLLSSAARVECGEQDSALYELSPESSRGDGCDEPCLCAVGIMTGLQGTFILTILKDQGLSREYEVSDLVFTVPFSPPLEVRGSGTYTTGGEGVSMQRLVLDLTVGQQPVSHWDSGPVAFEPGEPFPEIRLSVAGLHHGCFHTRFAFIASPVKESFVRGDSNTDGTVDVSDAIFIFNALFGGGRRFSCEDSADGDDSGVVDITDGIFLLDGLFRGGMAPPPPSTRCGGDPTSDGMGCASFPACTPVAE